MKKIAIQDKKKRSAIVGYESATNSGRKKSESNKIRRVKAIPEKRYDKVYRNENGEMRTDEEIFNQFISSNSEVDFEKTGCEIKHLQRFYTDSNGEPANGIWFEETIFDKEGNVKDVHPMEKRQSNVADVTNPLQWTNKYISYETAAKKYVVSQVYKICHVDSLTFDFLYEIARDLEDHNAVMYMGMGEKGDEPVVFREGGKPYRVFLKGATDKNKNAIKIGSSERRYFELLLLLSEMEYKGEN